MPIPRFRYNRIFTFLTSAPVLFVLPPPAAYGQPIRKYNKGHQNGREKKQKIRRHSGCCVILSRRKATVFTIAILASDPDRIDCGALEEQFTETAGTEDHPLTVSVTAYDPAEKENDQKLLADLRSHIVDLLIAEETVFTVFADRQCFGSLKDVLPADWPKGYYRWVPNGYPAYGIRIPDSGRIGMPDEKRYQYVAGISIASEHKEAAARVLLSLL